MTKVRTADLIGPALDWAVARADGADCIDFDNPDEPWIVRRGISSQRLSEFSPSTNWHQGGQRIEREEIGVRRNAPCSAGREWEAAPSILAKGAGGKWGYGPTPLIAAMRCLVASKLGDEVEVPAELLKD